MRYRLLPIIVWLVILLGTHAIVVADDKKPTGFEIRTLKGEVVIASGEIVSYGWETHTMTLNAGVVEKVLERLKTLCPKENMNRGIPFEVAVDGKRIYEGVWKTVLSSIGNAGVVICHDKSMTDTNLQKDQLRIDFGYPTHSHKGEDPRSNLSVMDTLRKADKLK